MKRTLLLSLSLLLTSGLFAQYSIGHTTITFNDPARTGGFGTGGGAGRQIQTEIYYPADVAGDDVAMTNGTFPVIVFGHGFAMAWDAYQNIWEEVVPEGYIIAFPRTEGGLIPGPSHEDFGLDLALVATKMQDQNTATGSIFENHVLAKTAIAGHSMGGGATILAAANNTSITTFIGMAPAETTPSAITAATNVSVPALIFSADEDMVTPAADHHSPIYNGLGSSCKYFVNIIGGAHCYYANSNFNCDFGESTSGGNISITRDQQQLILFRYAMPWLDLYLKDDCSKSTVFENDLAQDSEVTHQSSCSGFPTPSYNLNVTTNAETLTSAENSAAYQWLDCDNNYAVINAANSQSFTATQSGNYAVMLGTGVCADTSTCFAVQVADIDDVEMAFASIYPNPATDVFTVGMKSKGQLKIHSQLGAILYETKLNDGENAIQPALGTGIYLVSIIMNDQTITKRLIITH